jgi:hypothetical protein
MPRSYVFAEPRKGFLSALAMLNLIHVGTETDTSEEMVRMECKEVLTPKPHFYTFLEQLREVTDYPSKGPNSKAGGSNGKEK